MDRITDVTRDCLDALIQVRRLAADSLPAPAALHCQLRTFIDAVFTRAAQAGFSREDANDIAYALVALADDIVISRSEEHRTFWAGQSLQLHYFHINDAGEAFFTRLASIRQDPRRREILQAYYLALLLGFRGRYQVRGGELELLSLVEELQRELGSGRRFDSETLSPHGERPEDSRSGGRRSGLALWIGLGALGFAVLLYAGLRLSIGMSGDAVAARIDSATPR
jgi:type VI secretion system protein ImpK